MSGLSWMYAGLAHHLGGHPLYEVQATGPGRDLTRQGLPDIFRDRDVAAHYLEGVRRVPPEGPYSLCGRYDDYCYGDDDCYGDDIELFGAAGDLGNLLAAPAGRPRTVAATRETS